VWSARRLAKFAAVHRPSNPCLAWIKLGRSSQSRVRFSFPIIERSTGEGNGDDDWRLKMSLIVCEQSARAEPFLRFAVARAKLARRTAFAENLANEDSSWCRD